MAESGGDQRILIVGTGAMATFFAYQLARAGVDVVILGGWTAGIEALNRDGAGLLQPDGKVSRMRVHAINDLQGQSPFDLELVLVKAWQTEKAAEQLLHSLAQGGMVLTLQNGLGNREVLAARLGVEKVIVGVTTLGASLVEPGLARPGGDGVISLEDHAGAERFRRLFAQAKLATEIIPNASSLIWGKLVINAAINPLTALLGVPNGVLLEQPLAHNLMAELANEAALTAVSIGVKLPFADPILAAEEVARKTANNYSSMYQDLKRGSRTEIDAICGEIVRIANAHAVQVPVNWMMWRLVSSCQD